MGSDSSSAILACDLGTTGAKVSLVSYDGLVLASRYSRYKTYYPSPGRAEQSPQEWISAFVDGTRAVLSDAPIATASISAVAFSGHMQGCVPVDSNGAPLADRAMLWADRRSLQQAAEVMTRFEWDRFYVLTGAGLEVAIYPLAKIGWLREHEPNLYKSAAKFLGTKDVLVAWLTGRLVTDPSDASDTAMFDIHGGQWALDLLKEARIDPDKLPEVVPSATVIGEVTSAAAEATGLLQGTPVVLGAGDVGCAALGAGIVSEGQAYCCLGSASWVSFASHQPLTDPEARPFVLCHAVPGMYVAQLATYSAGVVVEWVLDRLSSLCDEAHPDAASMGYEDLMAVAAASVPGANGLFCLPHLRPGGAPAYDPNERGLLYGMQLSHTSADVVRAVVEGITFSIRQLVYTFSARRVEALSALRLIGGGSNSSFWAQLIADMTAKSVETLEVKQEANTLGAAMIGMVAMGAYPDFASSTAACVRPDRTATPDPQLAASYEAVVDRYRRLAVEARTLRENLDFS